jgi:hypothetical protein
VAAGALQSIDERMALLVDAVQRLSLARSLQDIQEVVRVCARSLTAPMARRSCCARATGAATPTRTASIPSIPGSHQ